MDLKSVHPTEQHAGEKAYAVWEEPSFQWIADTRDCSLEVSDRPEIIV
jgi:hypothetical protein